MSAFVVDPEHVNVMIWAGLEPSRYMPVLRWTTDIIENNMPHPDAEPDYSGFGRPYNVFELRPDSKNRVGQMLLDVNAASVNYRYSENNAFIYGYQRPRDTHWSVPELLKAIHCYEYQTCERSDWEQSEAYAFCKALERRLINKLPGYDDGPWEITASSVSAYERKTAELKAARR